nr:hypothetical protein [uncultured Butyrivibrio sp.]
MLQWQKFADAITRSYFGSAQRFDFYKMLSEMEKAIRPEIKNAPIDEKHIHLVPLDDGTIIEIDFHPTFTLVSEYGQDMKKTEILGKAASERGETATLRSFSAKLKKEKRGFGYPFPDMLQNMFRSLRAGEMFTFENGTSFLCTEKNGNIVTLKKMCGNILGDSDVTALLNSGKSFDVDSDSQKEIQALYRLIYDKDTDSAKGRIFSTSTTKDYVAALTGSAENNSDRRIDIGPIILHLKKGAFMSPAKWLDINNNAMSDEQINALYAWMSNAPVVIDLKHTDDDLANSYDDTCFSEYIEQFFKEGKFDNVYKAICQYVYEKKGTLKVEIKSYIRNNEDFYADGFVFSFEENAVIMRRATYGDNDITHKIVALKKSPARLFSDFCAEKYNSDYFLMKNKKRAVLRRALPKGSLSLSA